VKDATVFERYAARGEGGDLGVVRYENQRSAFTMQVEQKAHDFVARF